MSRKEWRGGADWDAFVRDKYTCRYCGLSIKAFKNRWDLFVADHLKPKAKGGPEIDVLNIVTACMGCNRLKSGFDPTDGGPAPKTREEQERLVQIASRHIEMKREEFARDAIEMQREAGQL